MGAIEEDVRIRPISWLSERVASLARIDRTNAIHRPDRIQSVRRVSLFERKRYLDEFESETPRSQAIRCAERLGLVDSFERPHHVPVVLKFRSVNDDIDVANLSPIDELLAKVMDSKSDSTQGEIRIDFSELA